jgi:Domain of unknown function (DUF4410)
VFTHKKEKIFMDKIKRFGPAVWLALLVAAAAILTSCGTTSGLQNAQGTTIASARKFSKVSVQNFKVSVTEHAEDAAPSAMTFPDFVATEIRKTRRFSSVVRNGAADANTLVIDGVITKYDEGSTSKRAFLGMGFGMAFLEANVSFRDNKGNIIGTIKVDKNSWPLGGIIAASQSTHSFMGGAADKIAEEALKLAR